MDPLVGLVRDHEQRIKRLEKGRRCSRAAPYQPRISIRASVQFINRLCRREHIFDPLHIKIRVASGGGDEDRPRSQSGDQFVKVEREQLRVVLNSDLISGM